MSTSTMIRPERLRAGDTVALVSASSPIPSNAELRRMVHCLEGLGLRVRVGHHATDRLAYLAGTDKTRLDDLNRALSDPEIRAIFFSWGGKGANHLLPGIDYEGFSRNPKIVVGLSDPSCIINALSARTATITFHGPTGVNFASETGLDDFTVTAMKRALNVSEPLGLLPAHSPWKALRWGRAVGRLYGGHLTTVQTLLGTPYEPTWSGAIFFWEEVGKTVQAVDLSLSHFRLRGVFDQISGMIVGRPLDCGDGSAVSEEIFQSMIQSVCSDYHFPILYNVDLGHADPKLTLPVGGMAELHVADQSKIEVIEAGVA